MVLGRMVSGRMVSGRMVSGCIYRHDGGPYFGR